MMRDAELIEALDNISRVGGVAVVHAENGDIVAEVNNVNIIFHKKKSLEKYFALLLSSSSKDKFLSNVCTNSQAERKMMAAGISGPEGYAMAHPEVGECDLHLLGFAEFVPQH